MNLRVAFICSSHSSIAHDYEISIPKLDSIVESAKIDEATGARLTGAGF